MSSRNPLESSPILARKLADLPDRPGVYLYRDEEARLLYVGKAKILKNRVRQYFTGRVQDAKTRRLVARIWDLETIVCGSELEALVLENNLIKEHRPPFNILLKDDKTYPYIRLTWKESFPRLFVTRKTPKDGSLYFGPFFPASNAYRTAELVYRFFQIRDCDLDIDGKRGRACMKYQLHRCTAPCIGAVSEEGYREQALEARLFLEGKRKQLKERISQAMLQASENLAFEQAAQYRDALQQLDGWFERQKAALLPTEDMDIYGSAVLGERACVHRLVVRENRILGREEYILEDCETFDGLALSQVLQQVYQIHPVPARIVVETEPEEEEILQAWLNGLRGGKIEFVTPLRGEKVELLAMAQENARIALQHKFEPQSLSQAVLEALQAFLGLPHLPRWIDCFDISHGQGREVVASIVVFRDGFPAKGQYRRMKITEQKNDDFAAMEEAVGRRYRRLRDEAQGYPDLVLVDGGLGQLQAAEQALEGLGLSGLELAALAKKEELVFRPAHPEPIRLLRSSPALHLLQRIRDEAHRFAVGYHQKLRAQRTLQTELTQIPGIGKISSKKLLQTFKSVKKILEATEEELEQVVGVASTRNILTWRQSRDETG